MFYIKRIGCIIQSFSVLDFVVFSNEDVFISILYKKFIIEKNIIRLIFYR